MDPIRVLPPEQGGLPSYAELHCLSNFTFLRGASHPAELIEQAMRNGYSALAITDECSLAGVVRAHTAARDLRAIEREARNECADAGNTPSLVEPSQVPQLLIGSELGLTDECGEPFCTLVALVVNRNGYGNLAELITLGRSRADKGSYRLTPVDLEEPEPELKHLKALPDCLLLLVPQRAASFAQTLQAARWLAALAPGRAWIALELWQTGSDEVQIEALREIAQASGLPLVAAGGVLMHARSRKPLQDTLSAIRLGKPLSACGYELEPNAERHLRKRVSLAKLYPADTLAETLRIAGQCRFSLDELKYEYPEELVPQGETPTSHLRKLVMNGARRRWSTGINARCIGQIEKELAMIADLKYEKYFLTVSDIVSYAQQNGILCQGRGSAANSVVCYCLGVTQIDPIQMEMLVERFISRARNEPPDIDIDFEHQRREEVIQHIYGKYGRRRAALTASVIMYRTRSAFRDVGKALGLDVALIERISKSQQWWDGPDGVATCLAEAGFDAGSHITRHLIDLTNELRGFPRHLSQHVGGFVIAKDKLSRLVPIENAAMKERWVIEWDKDDIDALGLLKVDVLALGMLSAIRRTLEFVALRRGMPAFSVSDIPRSDPAVYEMCGHADTIGVFQIESRAQQSMLPRLKPKTYYDLVVEVAIVRPGPIQGGMVHPYLRRRENPDEVTYPKEELENVLKRTLGVPIFQEQVMQLAMVAAKYTAEQADRLRRAMAAWRRTGNLKQHQDDLAARMRQRGYEPAFIERICKQIEGFGEYGFPESHAASFALLVYLSAWLKRYEPAAFLAGLLNSQPLGFYSPSQLVQDARRHGVPVLAPDVAFSDWDAVLEQPGFPGERLAGKEAMRRYERVIHSRQQLIGLPLPKGTVSRRPSAIARKRAARSMRSPAAFGAGGPAVRVGLRQIKGMSQGAAERIVAARGAAPFRDVDDLARRAALTRRDLEALAAANALASIAGHRREAWWAVTAQHKVSQLLRDAPIAEAALALPRASEGREIVHDYASLRMTLNRHPLALLRSKLARQGFHPAAALPDLVSSGKSRRIRVCGIVTGRQRPGTANGTVFVSLEDETGAINVIVWPALVEKQRKPLLGASMLEVQGMLQREGEVLHVIAERLEDRSELLGGLATESRDFH